MTREQARATLLGVALAWAALLLIAAVVVYH